MQQLRTDSERRIATALRRSTPVCPAGSLTHSQHKPVSSSLSAKLRARQQSFARSSYIHSAWSSLWSKAFSMVESFRFPVPKPRTERKTPEARSLSMTELNSLWLVTPTLKSPSVQRMTRLFPSLRKILPCCLASELDAFGTVRGFSCFQLIERLQNPIHVRSACRGQHEARRTLGG